MPVDHPSSDQPRKLVRRLLLYSAWQTFLGALFGLGLIAAVAALVLAVSFVLR